MSDAKVSPQGHPKAKSIILVDRSFQMRFGFLGFFTGLITSCLTAGAVLYPLYVFRILVVPRFLPTPIMMLLISALLINAMLLGILGVYISHRIAGPVFSITRQLRLIQDGIYRVRFGTRKGDELQFLAKHLSETSEVLVAQAQQDLDLVDKGDLETLKLRLKKRIAASP